MGGVTEVNTFTKIYLCSLGQYDYDAVPAIPPEIVLFPNWFWFNIYEISSWSRAILVPLSICYAKKPFKKIPDEMGVEELFVGGRDKSRMRLHWAKKLISWRNFFLVLDRLTHWFEAVHIRPLRSMALKRAEKWMLERFEMSDGLGAIYPSMMNSIIALRCLGYSLDDPQVIRAMDEFEKLGIEEGDTLPHAALQVAGVGYGICAVRSGRKRRAGQRSAHGRVRRLDPAEAGTHRRRLEGEEQAGTARRLVLRVQQRVLSRRGRQCHGLSGAERRWSIRTAATSASRCSARIDWIFSMQCKNGGWASFDKDNNRMVFQYIPFADHNAMLDPPTVDITGRMLEMLAAYGYDRNDPAVKKAIKFIRERAGAGRLLVRTLGRELHLRHHAGAARPGGDGRGPPRALHPAGGGVAAHGAESDGGWGETCGSYDDPNTKGVGPSTPSQTAWAVMGLLAAGDTRSDRVARGIAYLLRTQKKDGSWDEPHYTGRAFRGCSI